MDDPEQTYRDFHQVVNMAPAELERWLGSEQSRSVGITHDGDSESVGHHSGERIVESCAPGKPTSASPTTPIW